ncbi:hypothetical protein F5884DRAFT_37936 [Xylogone sp. PMI_703]|nr:hypothetical protein F5884DRAFT_37936 [Xylogone sp. PMI_703]
MLRWCDSRVSLIKLVSTVWTRYCTWFFGVLVSRRLPPWCSSIAFAVCRMHAFPSCPFANPRYMEQLPYSHRLCAVSVKCGHLSFYLLLRIRWLVVNNLPGNWVRPWSLIVRSLREPLTAIPPAQQRSIDCWAHRGHVTEI